MCHKRPNTDRGEWGLYNSHCSFKQEKYGAEFSGIEQTQGLQLNEATVNNQRRHFTIMTAENLKRALCQMRSGLQL